MKRLVVVPLAFVLGAAQAEPLSLQACSRIVDNTARLACYDRLARESAPAIAGAASAAEAGQRKADTASPAASAAAFGLEQRRPPASQELAEISSRIEGAFDGWTDRTRLHLANGQVWEIADGSRAAYRLQNPSVRITRGTFGTFFMEIDGVAQSPRVRRIN